MPSFSTVSAEETLQLGRELARSLAPGAILSFFGELGAGKTTLIKGVVSELTGCAPQEVCSPTFAYLALYEGPLGKVCHFDLYRLRDAEAFLSLGFEEYLFSGAVCCIEWSERIAPLLPANCWRVTLTHAGEEKRSVYYEIPECTVC